MPLRHQDFFYLSFSFYMRMIRSHLTHVQAIRDEWTYVLVDQRIEGNRVLKFRSTNVFRFFLFFPLLFLCTIGSPFCDRCTYAECTVCDTCKNSKIESPAPRGLALALFCSLSGKAEYKLLPLC